LVVGVAIEAFVSFDCGYGQRLMVFAWVSLDGLMGSFTASAGSVV
jgi:hypothetical protein